MSSPAPHTPSNQPFHVPVASMCPHRDLPPSKAKAFEERPPPVSTHAFYAGMGPPPSYHSFDGIWANHAPRPMARIGRDSDSHSPPAGQSMVSQHPVSANDELTNNRTCRADRRKHHRRRRSSSAHRSSWTAKLMIQGLRSNLFGSGNVERDGQGPKERRTKLDFSTKYRDIHNHYTVYNHCHENWPDEDESRTKTWPAEDSARHARRPSADSGKEGIPSFGFDAATVQNVARWPSRDPHPMLVEDFFSDFNQRRPEVADQNCFLEELFDDGSDCPGHGAHHPQATADPWFNCQWGDDNLSADDHLYGWDNYPPPGHAGNPGPASTTAFVGNSSSSYERDTYPLSDQGKNSTRSRSKLRTPDAGSELAVYNKRWDYIDTVQHPYPRELPWPAIRPSVPFDHAKCDVFSFFAKGCGLQPDRTKAPKLDFKLSPRSPYPSHDQRQRECEGKLLKRFKQQMKREKLRWHEDKLGRKFPPLLERDNEKRKAVWAAIAEGSEACDKRLNSML